MAANAPIIVNDGESTPVAHTFGGVSIVADVASYANRAEAFASGRETLTLRMKQNANIRTTVATLKIPRVIEETINGVAVKRVADYMTVRAECLVPPTWTVAQAKNGRVMGSNLLAHGVVAAMSDDGEFVW